MQWRGGPAVASSGRAAATSTEDRKYTGRSSRECRAGWHENPDRSTPLPVAENPMLQLLIKHMDQTENMQKMMQDMMKNMVSQRTPPAILLPSCPLAPLPALAASFPPPTTTTAPSRAVGGSDKHRPMGTARPSR